MTHHDMRKRKQILCPKDRNPNINEVAFHMFLPCSAESPHSLEDVRIDNRSIVND
jgi:hypothetical protein